MSYSVKALFKAAGCAALVLVVSLVLLLGVVGCGDDSTTTTTAEPTTLAPTTTLVADVAALVGEWYSSEAKETLEFTADGSMIWTADGAEAQSFPYTVLAGVITFRQPAASTDNKLPYTIAGSTLTTDDPVYGELTYTKQ